MAVPSVFTPLIGVVIVEEIDADAVDDSPLLLPNSPPTPPDPGANARGPFPPPLMRAETVAGAAADAAGVNDARPFKLTWFPAMARIERKS